MRKIRFIFAAALCLLVLAACGSQKEAPAPDVAGKTYTYENEGFGGDFAVSLSDDGSFSYYEGPLSSYIASGTWTLDGTALTLEETSSQVPKSFCFDVEGDAIVFETKNSDEFLFVDVKNGEKFAAE